MKTRPASSKLQRRLLLAIVLALGVVLVITALHRARSAAHAEIETRLIELREARYELATGVLGVVLSREQQSAYGETGSLNIFRQSVKSLQSLADAAPAPGGGQPELPAMLRRFESQLDDWRANERADRGRQIVALRVGFATLERELARLDRETEARLRALSQQEERSHVITLAVAMLGFAAVGGLVLRAAREENQAIARQAEALTALAASEAATRRVFDLAPIALAHFAATGDVLALNQQFTGLFGCRREEIPTLDDWLQRVHRDPKYRQANALRWRAALVAGPGPGAAPIDLGDCRIDCGSGGQRLVRVTGIALADGVLASFFDLTALHDAEARLALWAKSFEQTELGLAISDARRNVLVDVNPAYASQHGHERAAMIGMPVASLFPLDRGEDLQRILAALAEAPHGVFESEHIARDGRRFPVLLDITCVSDDSGEVASRLVYAVDLTAQKAAEQAAADALAERLAVQRDARIALLNQMEDAEAARQRAEQAVAGLHASESRLRRAIEEAPFPLLMHAEDGEVLAMSRAWSEITGYTHADIPTIADWTQRAYGEGANAVREYIEKNLYDLKARKAEGEYSIRCRDGEMRIWDFSSVGLGRDRDGRRVAISMAADVTERKRAAERLRDSEERLRLALSAANQGLYDLNVQTGEAIVSSEYANMLGYDPENFRETNAAWIERLHPDDHDRVAQAYRDYVEGRTNNYAVEFRQRAADGSWKWILSLGRIVGRDSDGHPLRLLGTHTDITALKQAEEQLRLMARRAEAMLDLPAAIDLLDEQSFMQRGQELAEDLTGSRIAFIHFVNADEETIELVAWSRSTLAHYCRAAHDKHYPISQAGIWADALRERRPVVFNDYQGYAQKRGLPDGHAELNRLISVPVIAESRVAMLAGVGNKTSDYTDFDVETVQLIANEIWRVVSRARIASENRQRLVELERINKRLEEAHNQLLQSEKMAAIGQLAAGVAHELNNPVGFVLTNLGVLAEYGDDLMRLLDAYDAEAAKLPACAATVSRLKEDIGYADLRRDLVALLSESREGLERVRRIVLDLKNFSRSGDQQWAWCDLHAGLDSTLNIVWNEIKYKAEVDKHYGTLPQVHCVPSQLNQVFMNLLVNAAQAIEGRGKITIATGAGEDGVWIEISDTGKGIPREHLKHIFEPFYTTKPVGQGTGLGLSIAFGIVERHHGRIEVRSTVGEGSCFRIELPVDAAPVAGRDEESS
jgi:PAS domain S-box-containing protein